MTAFDDVEVKLSVVKAALKHLLEQQLASMKVNLDADNTFEKIAQGGILLAKDTLSHFVDRFCTVLDTAAKQALEEAQDK